MQILCYFLNKFSIFAKSEVPWGDAGLVRHSSIERRRIVLRLKLSKALFPLSRTWHAERDGN